MKITIELEDNIIICHFRRWKSYAVVISKLIGESYTVTIPELIQILKNLSAINNLIEQKN